MNLSSVVADVDCFLLLGFLILLRELRSYAWMRAGAYKIMMQSRRGRGDATGKNTVKKEKCRVVRGAVITHFRAPEK